MKETEHLEHHIELDAIDKRILNILLENSKLSFRRIAKMIKKSVATVMHRIHRLEDKGIIKKSTILIDYELLDYDITVIIDLSISKGKLIQVEKKIAIHPNVFAVYDNTGPFDATIIAKFRTRRTMDDFLKKIQTYDFIVKTETKLVLNTIKEEGIKIR